MSKNCNTNPTRDIRDDLGQSHKCQKCKTVKRILALLALIFALIALALLLSPRTIYVSEPTVRDSLIVESQSSQTSASISSIIPELFESIKGETVRTGGK
jgi:predicted S18 family serine protease